MRQGESEKGRNESLDYFLYFTSPPNGCAVFAQPVLD